jgi:pimeloyl-[acyl-carrier protein] synthase
MSTAEPIFDPRLPEFHANPYPFYRALREKDPVHQSPLGFWVLTRYDDVVTSLRDQRFGRDGFAPLLEAIYGPEHASGNLPRSMLMRDPPDHTRLRALVNKAFTPRVIEGMRPDIQTIVDRLLDQVEGTQAMDVIADLAYPLPVTVICEMLGVPLDDHEAIRNWSSDIARSLDAIGLLADPDIVARGAAARRALTEYFRRLLPERRAHPKADLLSLLIAAEEQGDKLNEGELLAMCVLLFIAGHETTVNLIGNGILALLRHPDEMIKLRRDPALISLAIEELLRYDSPVQWTARITNTDVEIQGRKIPSDSMIIIAIGSANRDPSHFADPDRLDIARADNRHVAFGFGIHFCLGAPLARVEGQIALGTLLRRMPTLTLQTPTMDWRESSALRGLKGLPVTFE